MATRDGALARSAEDRAANDAVDWKRAHAVLSQIARKRSELDGEEGRWLLRASRAAAHVHLGFASFAEYIERLFGYRPRTTQEKLRVAEALEGLPCLARALEAGDLSWCAARELTRVAVAETESAWLEAARGKTQRELEALVADRSPGDAPDTPATKHPRPRVLRFEVSPETFATVREAMLIMRRQAGSPRNDDAILLAMARQVLGGPRDDGRASYQISLHVCAACGVGAQSAAGDLVPVDAAVVDMAQCDAQHLGELLPSAVQPPAAMPPAPAPRAANENASLEARPRADVRGGTRNCSHDVHADAKTSKPSETVRTHGSSCESATHARADVECPLPSDAARTPDGGSSHHVRADAGSWQRGGAGMRSATHDRSSPAHVGAAPDPRPPAPGKPSRRHSGAPSSPVIAIAAPCRAAPTPPSSTCITSSPAPKAVATKPRIS